LGIPSLLGTVTGTAEGGINKLRGKNFWDRGYTGYLLDNYFAKPGEFVAGYADAEGIQSLKLPGLYAPRNPEVAESNRGTLQGIDNAVRYPAYVAGSLLTPTKFSPRLPKNISPGEALALTEAGEIPRA
jgi:hypothetical protein